MSYLLCEGTKMQGMPAMLVISFCQCFNSMELVWKQAYNRPVCPLHGVFSG